MLKYTILLIGTALILAVSWGCDDRGTGIEPVDLGDLENWTGYDPSSAHVFAGPLTLQLRNPHEQLLGSVYFPPEAISIPPQHTMPLLVLLAPEGGNRFYYFQAGLSELIRELTASGEIQPMVVYCMSNDMTFGGYFYGDSKPAGHYDSIFQYTPGDGNDDLLEYLHRFYPSTIQSAGKRGIGGIGQGAYGAFRAIIKNPGVYSSISVTDGPLDFNGLTSLFDDALAEQHAHYALNPELDTSGTPLPFDFRRDFDSSLMMPISQMFIGGALAFSPDDTAITYDRDVDCTVNPTTDSVFCILSLDTLVQERISDTLTDSSTFISNLIKSGVKTRYLELDFHLPFDATGAVYNPIWDRWMANNLENMHEAVGGSPLADVNMWFGSNPGAKWGYYNMTQSWIDYCRTQGYSVEEYKYSSYTNDPVTGDEYLFDILREMLIFHSNSFGD
ncbi:MAG: hypothetical protein J7J98_09995 [candidate division Zixibacteria bacterium]|nr:hypothetical protein [candidate division Zixibacteria bacterium]